MATSSPTTTQTGGGGGTSTPATTSSHTNSDTAALYLFTFLATILILVLLSASLVLRSYILRRRYRQHFQQALTDGVFLDINGTGQFDSLAGFRRSARRPGPKPTLWDVWTNPPEKDPSCSWSSVTPVAVRCAPSLSPSTLISSSQPPTGSPSSLQPQPQPPPRPSFFSHLRLPSRFSLSPNSSSSLADAQEPFPSGSRSPLQTAPRSPDSSTRTEVGAATLSICVLVAMPDGSAPVYCPAPNTKGKGVESQPHSDDADPLLPSALRPRSSIPRSATEEGLPVLEFGVAEEKAGEWAWETGEA